MATVSEILNWRVWDDNITLSGQPTEAQLSALQEDGVGDIINIGPHSNDGALEDEPGAVAALGMRYTYIPVDFSAPTEADFAAFRAALDGLAGARVHVHCIYNARVSAFMYRRAREHAPQDEDKAFEIMDSIWRPGGVWAKFIGRAAADAHHYAGYDYTADATSP